MTPMEAIRCDDACTAGQIMMKRTSSASSRKGFLADLLLVDGDPAREPVDPARPEAAARGDEGRGVREAARDRVASALGPRRMTRTRRADQARAWRSGCWSAGRSRLLDLGDGRQHALYFVTLLNGLTLARCTSSSRAASRWCSG
jgi:hypothetical protein